MVEDKRGKHGFVGEDLWACPNHKVLSPDIDKVWGKASAASHGN